MDIKGLSAEVTRLGRGYLFAAHQKGGDNLVANALAKGAAAVLLPKGAGPAPKGLLGLATEEANPPHSPLWSKICAAWWGGKQPTITAAVTGTNGKTSVVSFAEQIWRSVGKNAASLGTLGLSEGSEAGQGRTLTTQEPFALHRDLAELAERGVSHLAMEVSSHALSQARADGVKFRLAVFTNLSPEHLDYHKTEEEYFQAKARLFSQLSGGAALVNADDPYGQRLLDMLRDGPCRTVSFGKKGKDLRILELGSDKNGIVCRFRHGGTRKAREYELKMPLIGEFQAYNGIAALALASHSGATVEQAVAALAKVKPPRGRMEAITKNIFVDYAHTPAALEAALAALKNHKKGHKGRLLVLFGCGGERDRTKRAAMGEIASKYAELVFVTDDNPRRESAAAIRRQIISGINKTRCEVVEIAERGDAIAEAAEILRDEDILLVAGKGHEDYQIVGSERRKFSDHAAILAAAKPLWSDSAAAFLGRSSEPWRAGGVSIDTRTMKSGELFVALPSKFSSERDGVRFLGQAARAGGAAAIVPQSQTPKSPPLPVLAVADCHLALNRLALKARQRSRAKIAAVTGTVGKSGCKEFLAAILATAGKTEASEGNFNNHLGVPLTLARLAEDTEFLALEMGMNHPGELTYLSTLARPHAVVITHVGEAHTQHFANLQGVAEAKAEALNGLEKGGTAILPIDNQFYPLLATAAKRCGGKILTFGQSAKADGRLLWYEDGVAGAVLGGNEVTFRPPVVGEHHALNALAALVASQALAELSPKDSAAGIADALVLPGRGGRRRIANFSFIDESYNAAPPSMAAGLRQLGREKAANKIAVVGDMLELGDRAEAAHKSLAEPLAASGAKVVLVGNLMAGLKQNLPKSAKPESVADAAAAAELLKRFFKDGKDYLILVKGSRGMAMERVIEAFAGGRGKHNAL